MENADAASRRLASLRNQLETSAPADISLNACSAPASNAAEMQYSVALPEKLSTDGPWLVHRYGWRERFGGLHFVGLLNYRLVLQMQVST